MKQIKYILCPYYKHFKNRGTKRAKMDKREKWQSKGDNGKEKIQLR